MKSLTALKHYFSKTEIILWTASVLLILCAFCLFDRTNYMTLWASLIGVTSLIFCAKGNPFGQFLMILFSLLYGIISLNVAYYGEMITYLGMTMPMAVFSLVTWMKNPFCGNRSEVEVYHIRRSEVCFMLALAAAVTFVFYFILKAFHTASLIPSTISCHHKFPRRISDLLSAAPSYAAGYAANDLVLIVLWTIATFKDISMFVRHGLLCSLLYK